MDRKIKKKKITPKRISGVLLAGSFLAFGFYQFVLGDYSTKLNVKKECPKADITVFIVILEKSG